MPVMLQRRTPELLEQHEIDRWRHIPVAVVVDVSRAACQIDPRIRPLCAPGQQPRLFGRAVTALCEPPDFGAVLHAVEQVRPGDVLVLAANGDTETAILGEILGGELRRRGGVGVICDGAVRDVMQLGMWRDFSVFARAITPRGPTTAARGAVNVDVVVGGRTISPGDLIIGDDDGLASLSPADMRAFIDAAEAKVQLEAAWQRSLSSGRSIMETFNLPAPEPVTP